MSTRETSLGTGLETGLGNWLRGALWVALAAGLAAPAGATTLLRQSLDELVASNATVVVGEVVDVQSYWNADGTFILTDVVFAPTETVKGSDAGELKVTVLGGTVGDTTTLIVGGPELIPGRAYVLFLGESDLPGAPHALTVRDHCQGVFDVVRSGADLRAVSQANGHPLVPDALGYVDAPGGTEGMPLASMVQSLRDSVHRSQNSKEIQ